MQNIYQIETKKLYLIFVLSILISLFTLQLIDFVEVSNIFVAWIKDGLSWYESLAEGQRDYFGSTFYTVGGGISIFFILGALLQSFLEKSSKSDITHIDNFVIVRFFIGFLKIIFAWIFAVFVSAVFWFPIIVFILGRLSVSEDIHQ